MHYHFIAIGGSAMHSLAIALQAAGHRVTGSDDAIFDPAAGRLAAHGLLPAALGWFPERINTQVDTVILGMHAFADNPELARAQALGIPVYSFPEFIFRHSMDKQRVVIAGSYGKTTVTAIVMHVLRKAGKAFDYLVGGQVPGFDNPVRLSDAPLLVVEGDEYPASKLDPQPKFLQFRPHIALINGISWDHVNAFPTEERYRAAFEALVKSLDKAGAMAYPEDDVQVRDLVRAHLDEEQHYLLPFQTPDYQVKDGKFFIKTGSMLKSQKYEMALAGRHNMRNLAAARALCSHLGVGGEEFWALAGDFAGVGMRMQVVSESKGEVVIHDFAHAPAKVRATVEAVREKYRKWNVIAVLELHTFSSLNATYLPMYASTLDDADTAIVCLNPAALDAKRMAPLTHAQLRQAFDMPGLRIAESLDELHAHLAPARTGRDVLLLMTSGDMLGYFAAHGI